MPHETKRRLRREVVAQILSLSPADRADEESALRTRFASLPGFDVAGTVLLYVSAFPEEIATEAFLDSSLNLGKRLILPRVDRLERRLRLFQVNDRADLEPGTLGIPEPHGHCQEVQPVEIDWALIPGIAFDSLAFRLGRGAGHYDRLLPQLRPEAPRWALALDPQRVVSLPVEPHDQPLNGVAGPTWTILRQSGFEPRLT